MFRILFENLLMLLLYNILQQQFAFSFIFCNCNVLWISHFSAVTVEWINVWL